MKKRILFDLLTAQPDKSSKYHGGGEYIKVIFMHLLEKYTDVSFLTVFFNPNEFLDEWIIEKLRSRNINSIYITRPVEVKNIMEENDFDVFYSGLPYVYREEWFPQSMIKIGTVHGIRSLELMNDKYQHLYSTDPEFKIMINIFKKKIKSLLGYEKREEKYWYDFYGNNLSMLDKVITDSEYSMSLIKNTYIDLADKIMVAYPPMKNSSIYEGGVGNENGKYILLIGGDRWIKNVYRAICSIEKLFKQNKIADYKVIIVGELTKVIRKRIQYINRYIFKSYVENEELERLYKYCDLFLYPTLNEGFGYPPLEAMRYGKTCCVSKVCSVPEVCGEAVYYFDPYDIEDMSKVIEKATDIKIHEETIINRLLYINRKQEEGIEKICNCIME